MLFESREHPGRSVRLAYCLNLHAAEDLAGTIEGIRCITLPLRDRLMGRDRVGERNRSAKRASFGIGLYLPAKVAFELQRPSALSKLEEFASFLADEALDPFTFNAFPFGGFHTAGLKRAVFAPTWCEVERLEYTLAVAQVAARLNAGRPGHVSISTHPGRFGAWAPGEFELALANFRACVESFATIARDGGPALRLALEAEPRAVAGDTQACALTLERLHGALEADLGRDVVERHLGMCLDACHSAVEFEDARAAVQLATRTPLGKMQYSSAISLREPGRKSAGRAALFALDEPRYLHQTTGRHTGQLLRVDDLPDLERACSQAGWSWLACDEWRTHFHVPVDLAQLGDAGLATTREHAAAILRELLSKPRALGSEELHVEIETYTWDILPGAVRGTGELVEGLEREYQHVMEVLDAAHWQLAST